MRNWLRNYSPWLAAVAVVAIAFYLVVFARPVPDVPELTPEDKAKVEEINKELDEIRQEIRELDELRRLHIKGKLWSA